MAGSAATGMWATLLWLPDLLLPFGEGDAPSDVINLALVGTVASFFGQKIEAERLVHARVEWAIAERLRIEAGCHELFGANRSPIVVVGADDVVRDANPAARTLFGDGVVGASGSDVVEGNGVLAAGQLVTLGGRDYRAAHVALPAGNTHAAIQLVFEDVTEERTDPPL